MLFSDSASSLLKSKEFRNDINGLRAFAVVSVVLYHFGVPGFSGGFVGVDVFFVISGYLMTRIIVSGMDNECFSLSSFYMARARRIIPPLLVLCVFLICFGWFYLAAPDYRMLGTHAAMAVLFVSNVKFWSESGYFDAASHDKWLLHTWSLSVEWQFYILLPLLIFAVWRLFGKRSVKFFLIAIGVISFALSIYAAQYWPGAAFYLLPTRAWEMLAGGMVWWLCSRGEVNAKYAKVIEFAGLAMIIFSVFLFDSETTWPGFYAALPVVGTMLVLTAERKRSVFTHNLIARRLGESSYSIYLWHWPVVVFLNYLDKDSWVWIFLGLLVTLILGEFSYRFVEKGLSNRLRKFGSRENFAAIGLAVVVVVVVAVGVRVQRVEGRVPPLVELASNEAFNRNPMWKECFPYAAGDVSPVCNYGGQSLAAIMVGDSYADATITALQTALGDHSKGIKLLAHANCPIVEGTNQSLPPANRCHNFHDQVFDYVKSVSAEIPVVLITAASAYPLGNFQNGYKPIHYFSKKHEKPSAEFLDEYSRRYVNSICKLAEGRDLYVVMPIPEMPVNVPSVVSRSLLVTGQVSDVSISYEDYKVRHRFIAESLEKAARACDVKILDPSPYLCSSGRCWGSKAGRPLYYDAGHMSEYGNKFLVPMFRKIFEGRNQLQVAN